MSDLIFVYNITVSNFQLILPIYYGTITKIIWGDGNTTTSGSYDAMKTHTYTNSGTYTVTITGSGINNINYAGSMQPRPTGAEYLIQCTSFGEVGLIDLTLAFSGASNLTTVPTSLPSNTTVRIMDQTFNGCSSFNQDISNWNVSAVTSMKNMFAGCNLFNKDISSWDVSNVTEMNYMFRYCFNFNNGEVALNWGGNKTFKVTSMRGMFEGANSFNQDISSWNVSNVTDMQYMFSDAYAFNQDITGWDVSKVTKMNNMFANAIAFNQNIGLWGTKTNLVTNMAYMFAGASLFNQDVSGLGVSNVTDMNGMFYNYLNRQAISFNNGGNTLNWGIKTNKVTDMSYMFNGALSFNQDISNWDVSNVLNMYNMFSNAIEFNKNINAWGTKTNKVTNMSNMFNGASAFNQNISSWDVSNVTDMSGMFSSTSAFNQDISGWTVTSVLDMSSMFDSSTAFNQDISGLNFSSVTNMSYMFSNSTAFNQDISNWNIPNVTEISSMFEGATAFDQDISNLDISNITRIYGIFNNSGLSITNYNNILNGWSALSVQPNLEFGGNGLVYSPSGLSGHNSLSTTHGWIFNNDAYISKDTINSNEQFNFTINITNSDTFYNPGNLTLSSNKLRPTTSTIYFDGNTPTTIAYNNLIFNTGGNRIPVILDSLDNEVAITYYLDAIGGACFNENTKIFTNKGYINIQNIRKGDLVKTLKDGYVPVNMIGKSKFYNSGNNLRGKNKLYKCTSEKYPELTEDLIITGCHSILVDKFKNDEEKKLTEEILGNIYITDSKYRLPACVDDKAIPYEEEGLFTIYHLALDHDNYYWNYGIYANGLLVESCSKRYMKELSGMDLID